MSIGLQYEADNPDHLYSVIISRIYRITHDKSIYHSTLGCYGVCVISSPNNFMVDGIY